MRSASLRAVPGAPAASSLSVVPTVPGAGPPPALPQRSERPLRAPPSRFLSSAPRGSSRPDPPAALRHRIAGFGGADFGHGSARDRPGVVPVSQIGSALLSRPGASVSDVERSVPAVTVAFPSSISVQLLLVTALLAAVPALQDRTVPPFYRYRPLPLWCPLSVCPRPRGAAGAPPPPQVPHAAVQHLPALRDVPVWLPLPLPAWPRTGGGKHEQPGQPPPPPSV